MGRSRAGRKRELCNYHQPALRHLFNTHWVHAATLCRVKRRKKIQKYIWGRTSSSVGLLQNYCSCAGSQEGKYKDNVEINLSMYSQASVRTWTSVHRWSIQDKSKEEDVFKREWETLNAAYMQQEQHSYLPPIFRSHSGNCQLPMGLSQEKSQNSQPDRS